MQARIPVLLFITLLCISGMAIGQDASPAAPSDNAQPHTVIVPWRHFGPQTAQEPEQNISVNARSLTAGAGTVETLPGKPDAGTTYGAGYGTIYITGPEADTQSAQPPSGGQQDQIVEQDLSKHHKPARTVEIPPADQNANSAPASLPIASKATLPPAHPEDNSPEARIAALTGAYKRRERARAAQMKQWETAAGNNPAAEAHARIRITRLQLEGEQDRKDTSEKLSTNFAAMADQLDARSAQVTSLIQSRKQAEDASEADLTTLNSLMPRLNLSLRNLAMLPASRENSGILGGLRTEIAADDSSIQLDQARSRQAEHEIQSLQADAAQLKQASAAASQKSAAFAAAAGDAATYETRLANRLEYLAARERAQELLAQTSQTLKSSAVLTSNLPPAAPLASSTPNNTEEPALDQLRACLRKSSNPVACVKGDQ